MQQQQQPGPVPTYRNVQGVRTEPPNQRTTYNLQRTTYGTYSVLSIPAHEDIDPQPPRARSSSAQATACQACCIPMCSKCPGLPGTQLSLLYTTGYQHPQPW
jgi:hypothetical protein